MLEAWIRERQRERGILLMTHIVLGYPSLDESLRVAEQMLEAGVDLMELQIPFSEPIADGPVILHANQAALEAGASVERCLQAAESLAGRFDVPFLLMSYYNILFKFGVSAFAEAMLAAGLRGAIVPDLPPEEADEYLQAMGRRGLAPIFIYSPNTREARMRRIAALAKGFVYCVARKGVTGASTEFSRDLDEYVSRCRAATTLPLAVGFGVKQRTDVDFLRGKADIAVIGTATIRVVQERGVGAVRGFIESLR